MEKFYVTYPHRLVNKRDCYSVVEAESYDAARAKVFDALGTEWAFLYTHEQFFGAVTHLGIKYPSQVEAFNLTEIPLTTSQGDNNGRRISRRLV